MSGDRFIEVILLSITRCFANGSVGTSRIRVKRRDRNRLDKKFKVGPFQLGICGNGDTVLQFGEGDGGDEDITDFAFSEPPGDFRRLMLH